MHKWTLAQALEIRWWRQYLRGKSVDGYLEQKKAYWRHVLTQLHIGEVNGRVLDAGCGPAGIFLIFPQQQIDAVDPLLERYEAELAHFHPGWYPNVRFFNQALEAFGALDKYDFLFCLNAINHVKDIAQAMDQLVAAARPGATIVLSIDAHKYAALKWLFRAIPGDALHPHQYDLAEYRAMLTSRGCSIRQEWVARTGKIFDYIFLLAKAPSRPSGSA